MTASSRRWLAHGTVKAALFLCTGILLNRFQTVGEGDLQGKGRQVPVTGVIFVLGGLALAGLPPFGTFLGKGMIEDAAGSQGYGWLTGVLILASVLTGGAVLRAAGHVFAGLGQLEEDSASRHGREEQLESSPSARTAISMVGPAIVLMAIGLALGLIPGVGHLIEESAARFLNQPSYARVVLNGASALRPAGGIEPAGPSGEQIASGLISTAGAVFLAFAALYRRRFPHALRRAGASIAPALQRLRGLQSGDVRDYVAWLTFGVAGIGAAFALLLKQP